MKHSRRGLALAAVWLIILAYGVYFSAYSIQLHRAFLTHASDLGQIDQAIWNTAHGHVLEHTKATGVQNIRLSDHVEPIFLPISLVFLLYDNVEALLILQSFAIAVGALAVFWIAEKRFARSESAPLDLRQGRRSERREESQSVRYDPAWPLFAGFLFAGLYLLFPALEAANLAEFHAVTLAPAPLLFAYHYGSQKAWGRFIVFSLLALAVKEEISLLVLFLAGWFCISDFNPGTRIRGSFQISDWLRFIQKPLRALRSPRLNPATTFKQLPPAPVIIAVLSFAWFLLTYFVIIPQFNPLGKSPYTCRYIISEDCRAVVRGLFLDARLGYLGQLFASSGWISLLDPLSLLLGLPLIVANAISNYPAQYSGTYHYSAPVAPYFILAAIGGSARVVGWLMRRADLTPQPPSLEGKGATVSPFLPREGGWGVRFRFAVLAAVALLALGYHLVAGYTPVAAAFRWPAIDAHDRLFERFAAQIPADAIVSTTASLNPHLSHRRVLYRYPVVNDAQYVLLDVAASNGHPTDFRVAYDGLLRNQGFGVIDAADGYVLLKRGAPEMPLPDAFYTPFRAEPDQKPQHPLTVDFGDKIRLLGYDVLNDEYGRAFVRFYWQALRPLDRNYYLYPFYADDHGEPIEDLSLPLTIIYWYPTGAWQPGEVVVGQTLPLDLGPRARLAVGVVDGASWDEGERLSVHVAQPANLPVFDDGAAVELGVLEKRGNGYEVVESGRGDK